jgi:hypothetical protein
VLDGDGDRSTSLPSSLEHQIGMAVPEVIVGASDGETETLEGFN